jgi:uridylate kinase
MVHSSPIVLSLGGSLIVPATGIQTDFLEALRHLVLSYIKEGQRFILVVGGGSTARIYMQAAKTVAPLEAEDMDWLGIHATRMNGHLLRTIFREVAHPTVIHNPSRPIPHWTKPLLVAAGWKPGWSTDYIAVRLARRFHAHTILNLTNIERVYSKDPNQHADAVPFDHISWHDFRKIVGTKWTPGSNAPFDPVASTWASRWKMKVVVAKGTDLKNIKKILDNKPFIGTTIEHDPS